MHVHHTQMRIGIIIRNASTLTGHSILTPSWLPFFTRVLQTFEGHMIGRVLIAFYSLLLTPAFLPSSSAQRRVLQRQRSQQIEMSMRRRKKEATDERKSSEQYREKDRLRRAGGEGPRNGRAG